MKILLVHHVADLYGSSRSLLRLATALVRDGHAVHVVLQEQGPLHGALQAAGAGVSLLPRLPVLHRNRLRSVPALLKLIGDFRATRRALLELLGDFQPDLVHSNSATTLPVAGRCARQLGIPHVLHIREFFGEFGFLWKAYRAWLLRTSDLILCVSAAVATQFPPGAPVAVLHNGFPATEFTDVPDGQADAFRRLHAAGREPLAGVIGRIKLKRKGQETFIQAAALLKDRFPAAGFLVIGAPFPGNEKHEYAVRNLAADLQLGSQAIFTGEIPEPRAAFAALDVVVMSSGTPEPFGGVVIEAMAYGKPVVGTAIGGTPEQIVDGETGLLVPPNDPAAMAAALARLFGDEGLRRELGRKARARFLAHFEFEPFYAALLRQYQNLLAGKRQAAREA